MDNSKIMKIGVLTSGGDAPGMNAAIRSVVRSCIFNNIIPVGIYRGYKGLVRKNFVTMQSHSVSKIIQLGGTILKSSRLPEFATDKLLRKMAIDNLREDLIDALVVIGGDGSFRGANLLSEEFGYPIVGIPGTIDNDIYGTDYTIGFDTAINTAMEAIDKIRDTADSHNHLFFVEVMGRDAGFIATYTAIATGAEATVIPEVHTSIESICTYMQTERRKNKTSGIVIVSEGSELGSAVEIAAKVNEILPDYKTRVTTLGHIQRGGSPSTRDRVLASLLGNYAVNALRDGKSGVMVGIKGGQVSYTPFKEACSRHNPIDANMLEIAKILSI
ncbi:MAG: 6-phosphofructokinase [Bacteroidales bacterium]|nr:6-phosphofructokinase [Bacteroidales bacterium]